MFRRTLIVGSLVALMAGPVAVAQQATTAPASQANALAETMRDLRQSAARLTLLNALPEEARAEATALLDRMEALRTSQQELEVARLQAYVAALEAGESPTVARELAAGEVATQSADVTRTQEQLMTDLEAFVTAHPEVRGSFLQSSAFGRGLRAGASGMQLHGMFPGGAPGGRGWEGMQPFRPGGQNHRMR